jgi:hypothetical protein
LVFLLANSTNAVGGIFILRLKALATFAAKCYRKDCGQNIRKKED